MFAALFTIGLGNIVRFVERKQFIGVVIVWMLAMFLLSAPFNQNELGGLLIVLLIKAPFFYVWLMLLDMFEDTIFRYLIILIIGGIMLA